MCEDWLKANCELTKKLQYMHWNVISEVSYSCKEMDKIVVNQTPFCVFWKKVVDKPAGSWRWHHKKSKKHRSVLCSVIWSLIGNFDKNLGSATYEVCERKNVIFLRLCFLEWKKAPLLWYNNIYIVYNV